MDSKGTLYFCSRGAFKGILTWTKSQGARRFVDVDAKNGPGALWIDKQDNIFVTGPGDRKVFKVSPARDVTVLAEDFEPNPKLSKGPNDLAIAANGSIYFTDPNGFYGDASAGTIYRLTPERNLSVFDHTVIGPNGITISQDGRTLFVAGNVAKTTAKVTRLQIEEDGSAGAKSELATVENCVGDGMDIDREGNVWLTCYSFGTAHRISPQGRILETITTEAKALTNCVFGNGADRFNLYLTSSHMDRSAGHLYRAKVDVPGFR